MKSIGIYIHIPFCIKKCNYCNFNSFDSYDQNQIKAYTQALFKDIETSAKKQRQYTVNSIYIGGGTPSFIKAEYIRDIIKEIRQGFKMGVNPEIAIEVNPNSVSKEKLLIYKKAGINRISMGVQSFNNKYLKILGRAHSADQIKKVLNLIKQQGFKNISIDLIYGIPDQSLADWQFELKSAIDSDISHISLYDLVIEKNTLFYDIRHQLNLVDNDQQTLMYKAAHNILTDNKFIHYEISSFAKNNMHSRHNLIYWNNLEYIGFGAGAYSYINRERFSKAKDILKYQQQAEKTKFRHYQAETLSPRKLIEETLILRLRLLSGFKLINIEDNLNQKMPQQIIKVLNEFIKQGFILFRNNRYKLSKKGLLHYDTIASEFLS